MSFPVNLTGFQKVSSNFHSRIFNEYYFWGPLQHIRACKYWCTFTTTGMCRKTSGYGNVQYLFAYCYEHQNIQLQSCLLIHSQFTCVRLINTCTRENKRVIRLEIKTLATRWCSHFVTPFLFAFFSFFFTYNVYWKPYILICSIIFNLRVSCNAKFMFWPLWLTNVIFLQIIWLKYFEHLMV